MLHLNLGHDVDLVTGPRIHLRRGSAEVDRRAQSLLDGLTVVEIKADLRFIDKFHSSAGFSLLLFHICFEKQSRWTTLLLHWT